MSAPGLRSRASAATVSADDAVDIVSTKPKPLDDKDMAARQRKEDSVRLSILDILRMLGGVALLAAMLSYFITRDSFTWHYRPKFFRTAKIKAWLQGPLYLTDVELARFNGSDPNLPILLALNGTIYDVSAAPQTYGPDGSYHFLSGRDATRAFVTGCFDSDLNGDLRGVEEMFMAPDLLDDSKGAESNSESSRSNSESKSNSGSVSKSKSGSGSESGSSLTPGKRREKKLRRERERRLAKQKVFEAVDGWRRLFDGGKDGAYFRRGRVNRGPDTGWQGWGPIKELCEGARMLQRRRTAADIKNAT